MHTSILKRSFLSSITVVVWIHWCASISSNFCCNLNKRQMLWGGKKKKKSALIYSRSSKRFERFRQCLLKWPQISKQKAAARNSAAHKRFYFLKSWRTLVLILQQRSFLYFLHRLKKKIILPFEHQKLFHRRDFFFSTRSSRNPAVSHIRPDR